MPEKFGEKHAPAHTSESKAPEAKPDPKAELDRREHEFVAVYGTVFGATLEPHQRAKVRAAIEKELETTKS
jgi:hypothetical protein